ncbi:UNVERIFIED_CONTAM: hypothetical protein Slati_4407000 [Sesamum latifolium]|uniref:Uncharacterized protein n=1 Tax=Sesamum latifolium TaxID=2727402 RepID=A0AAW2SPQ6_9LAMI
MAEGSSVQSHGVKMLSLVEKLEDLKAGLNNDTYIDMILQSLPSSYDPFIVNYNMNGLDKSIHELINMLVQYEATTHKSEPSVLIGEASTSKAKGKGARRWKRKKEKGVAVTATASTGGAPPAAPKGKGKGKVLQRSRNLSKDEMILRLGDGKAVAAEAVGSLSLVVSNHVRIDLKDCYFVPSMSNLIMTAQHKRKVDNHENAQIWHARLCHISKDRIMSGLLLGRHKLNGVPERRNRTLLDMVRSMMSFTELPPSFWGHALETAVYLISERNCGYYFYDSTEQKVFISRNAVFLKKGFPSDNRRDEVLIEKSSGEPPHDSTASFEPTVHTDGVPVLRRSTRESRVPERYGFVGLTSQLDNDPKTYGEAMSDIDSDKWLEAMKSEMDSMG